MAKLIKAAVDFPDTAPVRIVVEASLKSSAASVWEMLIDNPGWVNWFNGVTLCENTSDPASGVGATRRIVVNGLLADEEFIAWEPQRLWAFTVLETSRSFARRWVERVEIEPAGRGADSGCRVRYSAGLELLLLAKLFRPVFTRSIRKSWEQGLAGIDDHHHAHP